MKIDRLFFCSSQAPSRARGHRAGDLCGYRQRGPPAAVRRPRPGRHQGRGRFVRRKVRTTRRRRPQRRRQFRTYSQIRLFG